MSKENSWLKIVFYRSFYVDSATLLYSTLVSLLQRRIRVDQHATVLAVYLNKDFVEKQFRFQNILDITLVELTGVAVCV